MDDRDELVPTAEAAALLGVRPETLYAYVSRGRIRSHRLPGRRGSAFARRDLEALRAPAPDGDARALDPILSAITDLRPDGHAYRGVPAHRLLADGAGFEEVVDHLWGEPHDPRAWRDAVDETAALGDLVRSLEVAAPIDRVVVTPPLAATRDPFRTRRDAAGVARVGRRLLAAQVAAVASPTAGRVDDRRSDDDSHPQVHGLAAHLAAALADPGAPRRQRTKARLAARVPAVETALVLLADHGLAGSTFAARIAASYGGDPYAVVSAGLAVVTGARHGAASNAVGDLIVAARRRGIDAAIADHVAGDADLPGLGHPLYPDGDPRWPVLYDAVVAADPDSRTVEVVDALVERLAGAGLPAPNVDMGLGLLTAGLGLVRGAGEVIFAVARTAGWVAHAREEYAAPSRLRPRARYVGP